MNFKKRLLLFAFIIISFNYASSQNAMINILSQNAGIVKKGKRIFIEITVNNTDPSKHIGIYKLKPQINIPGEIVKIDSSGHNLPTGWLILSNSGSSMTLSNCKDIIAPGDARTILIAVKGINKGGPSTVSCQLNFSNGFYPGTEPGTLQYDSPADNSSTTTIKVVLK